MRSTNRGTKPVDHEHYATPAWAVRAILPTLGAKYEGELARESKQASLFGGGS